MKKRVNKKEKVSAPIPLPKSPFQELGEEYEAAQQKLSKLLNYWREAMGLTDWSCDVSYVGGVHETNQGIRACIRSNWEYQQMYIRFFLHNCVEIEDSDLEMTVVHELCHALVNPMSRDKPKMHQIRTEEIAVGILTKAFLRTKYPQLLAKK